MDRAERLIRDAKPPAELDDRAEAALARILATPVDAERPRGRRGWVRLGAVAAVLVLGLALFLSPLLGGRGGATAEAASVLDAAARAVEDTPSRADQYWKVTTRGVYPQVVGDGPSEAPDAVYALQPEVQIAYVAVDGSRPGWLVQMSLPYLRQVSGPPTTLPVKTPAPSSFVVAAPEPDYRLGELSLDPDELRDQLYARSAGRGNSRDDAALEEAAGILRIGYASADLRRSLFAAMRSIRGVKVVDRGETQDGRAVVALGRDERSTGEHRELLFAADTGEYVGERSRWSDPEWHVSEATFTRELVDKIDDDPSQIHAHR
jgi:RNA polymerase sigma-70 factor (ECF subfamily)